MTNKKSDPYPVRLDEATGKIIKKIAAKSGLSRGEILRRAINYSAPKFLSGEVQMVDASENKGL